MARMKMNLSGDDAAAADRSLIPEGVYAVLIHKVEKVHPKKGDNTAEWMYNLQLKIQEGEKKGRTLFATVCLWYKARYSLLDLLNALGEEIAEGELEIPEEHELTGRIVNVKVKHREYNDELSADVKFIAGDGGAPAKASAGKTKLPLRSKTALPKAAS